jgi:hypothetical protein
MGIKIYDAATEIFYLKCRKAELKCAGGKD